MLPTCKSWLKPHFLMETPKPFPCVQPPTIFFERMKTSVLPFVLYLCSRVFHHVYGLCASDGLWYSVQFSSVAQSCPTLCNPMNCSTPGLPVHHHLLEFTQTHVHQVGDAIQPTHPLSSPFPPAPYPSQHQSLFQ